MAKQRRGSLGDARARMQKLREVEPEETQPAVVRSEDEVYYGPPPSVKRDKGTFGGRYRTSVYLNREIYGRAQAAIRDLGDQGEQPSTISQLLDDALARELKRLAKKHRDGVAWDPLPIRSKR